MVDVSASVKLLLHHKRSSLLAPAHAGGSGKRAVKRLWCGGSSDSSRQKEIRSHGNVDLEKNGEY